jgi:hypothetical protein
MYCTGREGLSAYLLSAALLPTFAHVGMASRIWRFLLSYLGVSSLLFCFSFFCFSFFCLFLLLLRAVAALMASIRAFKDAHKEVFYVSNQKEKRDMMPPSCSG